MICDSKNADMGCLYNNMKIWWTLSLIVGFLYLVGTGWSQPVTPVRVDPVCLENVEVFHVVTGQIRARRKSTVASEQDGIVLEVPFDSGDTVKAGDVLAILDSDLLKLDLEEALAQFSSAKATCEERQADCTRLQRDLESIEDLSISGAAQPKELEDARSLVTAANARLTVAKRAEALTEVRIRQIERRLESVVIKAPFDGIVVTKQAEVGQWMQSGGAVVDLIEINRVDAVIDVPEKLIGQLSIGMKIDVITAISDQPMTCTLRSIIPQADERARTYPVRIDVANPDGLILPGMSVQATVPTGSYNEALTVNKDAIVRGPTGNSVYVVRGDSVFPASIRIVSGAGLNRVVVSGDGQLAEGDMIVIEGNERLYPGAKVSIASDMSTGVNGGGEAAGTTATSMAHNPVNNNNNNSKPDSAEQ